jgi:acyl-CoA synthetase (NDP forming)
VSLDVFFAPKTVAVIGATENTGSVGRTILWNLGFRCEKTGVPIC